MRADELTDARSACHRKYTDCLAMLRGAMYTANQAHDVAIGFENRFHMVGVGMSTPSPIVKLSRELIADVATITLQNQIDIAEDAYQSGRWVHCMSACNLPDAIATAKAEQIVLPALVQHAQIIEIIGTMEIAIQTCDPIHLESCIHKASAHLKERSETSQHHIQLVVALRRSREMLDRMVAERLLEAVESREEAAIWATLEMARRLGDAASSRLVDMVDKASHAAMVLSAEEELVQAIAKLDTDMLSACISIGTDVLSAGGGVLETVHAVAEAADGTAAAGVAEGKACVNIDTLRLLLCDARNMYTILKQTPDHFKCPISLECMKDPVIMHNTAQTYERAPIEQWLRQHPQRCPLTGPFRGQAKLVPNYALKGAIEGWIAEQRQKVHHL